ncbi:MAG TPA: UbiA family prenyltransferase [Longimicrobiales bacterium]|nr:UbiA family prenyltransferase [Longimicrobiales bacterium]
MTGQLRSGWTSMVVERLALPPVVLMATALSVSIQILAAGRVETGPTVVTVLGITGLLVLLRVMDDLKDLERDRIAHPDRPLPRGALSPAQARRGVALGLVALLAASLLLAVAGCAPAAGFLAFCAVWAFLMYREFFASRFLGERPLLYAVTHQAIVLPMYGFAAATIPWGTRTPEVWWFAATGLGASFTWEICRKLDPDANPVLGTYLHRLGRPATVAAAGTALAVVMVGAARLGLEAILWPAAAVSLAGLPLVFLRPRAYKLVAGAAALLVGLQPLAPALRHWLGGGS